MVGPIVNGGTIKAKPDSLLSQNGLALFEMLTSLLSMHCGKPEDIVHGLRHTMHQDLQHRLNEQNI